MTYCQIHAIRAVLYQCYTNARKLMDVATMKAFMPVLESTPVRDIIKVSVWGRKLKCTFFFICSKNQLCVCSEREHLAIIVLFPENRILEIGKDLKSFFLWVVLQIGGRKMCASWFFCFPGPVYWFGRFGWNGNVQQKNKKQIVHDSVHKPLLLKRSES